MKVTVNKEICTGHGRCNAMAPEIYQLDENAQCAITELEVPAGLEDKARLGARSCPEQAITISE